jgi:hypothetical protein
VKKRAPGQFSDLKVGDQITAIGVKNGNAFDPQIINIGMMAGVATFGGGGGGGLPAGQDTGNVAVPGPGGGPPSGGPNAASDGGLEPLFGSIEKIDGNKLTVKSMEGQSFTMDVTDQVKVNKQVDAKLDDIQAGRTIMAQVTGSGQVIQATQVQILPDAPQP